MFNHQNSNRHKSRHHSGFLTPINLLAKLCYNVKIIMERYMTTQINPNPAVTDMADELQSVRAAVLGSYFVKKLRDKLLPHPSAIDQKSPEQVARYAKYLADADFDDFTQTTETSLIDRMNIQDTEILLPEKLEYLREDADGDGLSLNGLLTTTAENILQVKWHVLLTDYKGLSDTDTNNVSIADLEKLNPRATIKQYTRENVIDWDFARINGRMQLTYILLREMSCTVDHESMVREKVTSYLKLAIDDEGYYQQKYVEGGVDGGYQQGEKNYVKVNKQALDFIPLEIVADSELQGGMMPLKAGYLVSISNLAYTRYQTSATYKEVLRALVPTVNVFGMDDTEYDTFKKVNGRDYLASGVYTPNFFGNPETRVEILNAADSTAAFERFFDRNEKLVRAEGGVFNTDSSGARTATEVIEEASTSSAILTPLSASEESSLTRCIIYAGMFEGLYQPDNLQAAFDDVIVDMPSDFAGRKISPAEAKEFRETYLAGAITLKTYLTALKLGGWKIDDIEGELNGVANQAHQIV